VNSFDSVHITQRLIHPVLDLTPSHYDVALGFSHPCFLNYHYMFSIYKQWNERFFFELYSSYMAGRSATDPSIGWYKGEIGFFDFYIIPLAKKLESCGCFGVSSDEYLSYAKANREEWVREGEKMVDEYIQRYIAAHGEASA
jgi:hypothetical protein